jgi:hypothetical protein
MKFPKGRKVKDSGNERKNPPKEWMQPIADKTGSG